MDDAQARSCTAFLFRDEVEGDDAAQGHCTCDRAVELSFSIGNRPGDLCHSSGLHRRIEAIGDDPQPIVPDGTTGRILQIKIKNNGELIQRSARQHNGIFYQWLVK